MFRPRACQPAVTFAEPSAGFYGFPAPLRSAAEFRLGRPGAATPKHLTHRGLRERPDGARAFPRGHRPTTCVGGSDDFGMKKLDFLAHDSRRPRASAAAAAQANPADPASAAPALRYQSAFSDYKPWQDIKPGDWRAVNDSAARQSWRPRGHGTDPAGALAPSLPAPPRPLASELPSSPATVTPHARRPEMMRRTAIAAASLFLVGCASFSPGWRLRQGFGAHERAHRPGCVRPAHGRQRPDCPSKGGRASEGAPDRRVRRGTRASEQPRSAGKVRRAGHR